MKGTDTGEKIVRFGGLDFTTISDSGAWLDKNPEGIKFGYFIDVYNLCTLAARAINGESDCHTKNPPSLDSRMKRRGVSPPNLENVFFGLSTKFALESPTPLLMNRNR